MVFNFAYERLTRTMFSLTKCLRAHMSKFERIFFTYAQDLRELTDTYETAVGSYTRFFSKKVPKTAPSKKDLRATYGHLRGCCAFASGAQNAQNASTYNVKACFPIKR